MSHNRPHPIKESQRRRYWRERRQLSHRLDQTLAKCQTNEERAAAVALWQIALVTLTTNQPGL